ncbi:MAG: hypothetical protein HRU51_04570 [Xanthomonadales bacterium]|nr:hypothetical protein [Xanthomonadales bacterium]
MKKSIALFAIAALSAAAFSNAQQGFSTIEERMTGKEFTAAGLDKLSDEELSALNEWLRARSVATLENESRSYTDTRGFENQTMAGLNSSDVMARVKGNFSGWTGDTVFELDNGMIWEQVEDSTFYMSPTNDAVVVIEKGVFNSWRLRVDGYNKTVRVRRVE